MLAGVCIRLMYLCVNLIRESPEMIELERAKSVAPYRPEGVWGGSAWIWAKGVSNV